MKMSLQRTGPGRFNPWNWYRCPFNMMLGGPQSRSGIFGDKNEHLILPGIEMRIIQPLAERFLFRLR